MILYLSSKKFGKDIGFLKEWIKEHNNKLLLIFNALDAKEKEKINSNISEDIELLEKIGFSVEVVDLKKYFGNYEKLKQDLKKCSTYCVIGGNVFVLRQAMKYSGFDKFLHEITSEDFLYIGYSAGSCVLSNNLDVFDIVDEAINFYKKEDIIYEGLGLINYVFVPHYKSDYHKVELIDAVIEKCHKNDIKYNALKDGEVIIEKLS